MAVRQKTGLDYFSLSVNFFVDEKIEHLSARFGHKGELITVKLLCKIYTNGYYTNWKDDDSTLFAKRAGDFTPTLVNDIVLELVRRGFFDKSLLDSFGILTSKGIQSRYLEAAARRKKVDIREEFLLVDATEYDNVNILPRNVNISPPNADILQQSKVKESKEENTGSSHLGGEPPSPPSGEKKEAKPLLVKQQELQEREALFRKELEAFEGFYGVEMINAFFDYWTEPNKSKTKMGFEMQTKWDLKRRLRSWKNNEAKFGHKKTGANGNAAGKTLTDNDILKQMGL